MQISAQTHVEEAHGDDQDIGASHIDAAVDDREQADVRGNANVLSEQEGTSRKVS